MKTNPIYAAALASWSARPGSAVYVSTTDTAKLIRAVLKATFPNTRFSVRSDKYAGGSSIRVRWTDGPTAKLVDAYLRPYAGAGFDGMIDMKYHSTAWLYPDGFASFAGTGGTEGSRGTVPAATGEPAADGAIPVRFSADYVFTNRDYSADALERVLLAYAAKWDDELARAIRAGAVAVETNKWGSPAWTGLDGLKSDDPTGNTYGAFSALWAMAGRRMLPVALPRRIELA